MKILTANIALGLRNMDNLLTNLRGGSKFHSLFSILVMVFLPWLRGRFGGPPYSSNRINYLREHEDLNLTVKLISESDPDILILNEILPEIHHSRLDKELKNMGFVTTSYGLGAKYSDAHISTLVAVKEQGAPISITMPQTPHPGCGGGIAGIRLKNNTTVIGAHMALGGTNLWSKQLESITSLIEAEQAQGNEVIFAGDCNRTEKLMTADFLKLEMVSADKNQTPTCPTFFPHMFQMSLDHIFVPSKWKINNLQTIAFGSDHLAMLAEVL